VTAEAKRGSLVVVGTGIMLGAHITAEAEAYIRQADCVLYMVTDEAAGWWLRTLNPRARSLAPLYADHKRCLDTYGEMTAAILDCVRAGQRVCAVFYGHPGVFVLPAHAAIRQARAEGYPATLCPGISAEDCLFADLGVDPGRYGCQSFEATDFLIRRRRFDPHTSLILWQVGLVGELHKRPRYDVRRGLEVLAQVLGEVYPPAHEVVIYTAARFATQPPDIRRLPLQALPTGRVQPIATLYVPPRAAAPVDPAMLARLGIDPQDLVRRW
jgi:precorrin-6B methylase 1